MYGQGYGYPAAQQMMPPMYGQQGGMYMQQYGYDPQYTSQQQYGQQSMLYAQAPQNGFQKVYQNAPAPVPAPPPIQQSYQTAQASELYSQSNGYRQQQSYASQMEQTIIQSNSPVATNETQT